VDLLICWVLFPALLLGLAAGWGRVVELAAGRRLALAILPVLGFAGMVVAGQFLTLTDATAELTTPAFVVVGALGLAAWGRRLPSAWGVGAVAGVFAVYAAPIVLSGEATFAGYIRLDDTATWMALTDRVMEHGRSLDGLAPSTYEATLAFNLADGYPIGVFLALGAGRELVGQDVAWLIQPYMAWLAALLALSLWALVRPLVTSPRMRAVVVFLAAQPALLFGYYLWGGIKELAAAALVVATAACVAELAAGRWEWRQVIAPAVLVAALTGVLSLGGLVWLAPAAGVAAAVVVRRARLRTVGARALWAAALIAALVLPVAVADGLLPPTSSALTDAGARGNLLSPLEPAQVAGIWPAGDFRFDPVAESLTIALIAVVIAGAGAGLAFAWARRAWGVFAFIVGGLAATALIWLLGSPWVEAKALATASPAVPLAALLGGLWLWTAGRRAAGGALVVVIAGGILWSNALAYREVNLAPRDRLAELETIGTVVAGEGPTLMTEYEPYGVRHFLRNGDAEGASELRRRRVPLASGETLTKGDSADTDMLDPDGLMLYRTLVLRRSPVQSRPPAAYRLVWSGDSYEVWQRPPGPAASERLALGSERDPLAVPRCADVAALARSASRGSLVAATRPRAIAVSLAAAAYPDGWALPGAPAHPQPREGGQLVVSVHVRRAARYTVWLGGSVRPRVRLLVDGDAAGSVRHVLGHSGQYVLLGSARLSAGEHEIELDFGGADLHPGSGGAASSIGPLVLSAADPAETRIVRVDADRARRLCGRAWDWIEADG
jgi:hypothetical protein